jgi:16S rRNA processing protein RimM
LNQFVSIAKITRTHGVRGEVAAILLTDFPERFDQLQNVYLSSEEEACWEELEKYRFHKDRVILKFRGRDRAHQVQDLLGREVQILEADRMKLPVDTFYDSDLMDCEVFEGSQLLGRVVGLLKSDADHVNLVVLNAKGEEFMVPLVKEFVKEIDTEGARIAVDLPPGLLELAAGSPDRSRGRSRKGKRGR